jgi:hypothetical protein
MSRPSNELGRSLLELADADELCGHHVGHNSTDPSPSPVAVNDHDYVNGRIGPI